MLSVLLGHTVLISDCPVSLRIPNVKVVRMRLRPQTRDLDRLMRSLGHYLARRDDIRRILSAFCAGEDDGRCLSNARHALIEEGLNS